MSDRDWFGSIDDTQQQNGEPVTEDVHQEWATDVQQRDGVRPENVQRTADTEATAPESVLGTADTEEIAPENVQRTADTEEIAKENVLGTADTEATAPESVSGTADARAAESKTVPGAAKQQIGADYGNTASHGRNYQGNASSGGYGGNGYQTNGYPDARQGYGAGNGGYGNSNPYGQAPPYPNGQNAYNGPYYQTNQGAQGNPYGNPNTYRAPGQNGNPYPGGNNGRQMNGQPGSWGYYPESPYQGAPIRPEGPEEPMKISEWIVTLLVLSIPCVGIVMLFVWGFSSTENRSKANFCKAALIWSAIVMVIAFVFYMVVLAGIISGLG